MQRLRVLKMVIGISLKGCWFSYRGGSPTAVQA